MKADQYSQRVLPVDAVYADEGDEGGLDLGQTVAAIRRKAFLILGITATITAAAVFKALTDTPIYQSSMEILARPVSVETEVVSSNPDSLSRRREEQQPTQQPVLTETQLKVLQSPGIITPVVEELQSQYPGMTYGDFVSSLGISVDAKDILVVSYQHPDRELVRTALDAISEAYLEYSLKERQADIRVGLEFIESQLNPLQEQVNEQQQRLQVLRQENNLIDPESKGGELSGQTSTFTSQQLETQLELRQARSLYAELEGELAQSAEAGASSALTQNARYQRLLDLILDVNSQMAQGSALFRENSREMQVLADQRESLYPLLRQEGQRVLEQVASQIRELETRSQALERSIGNINSRIDELSEVSRQYTDIQRELQIATDNLNLFLSQREALRIDAAQEEIPWEVLTPPGEPSPVSASVTRNAALGIVLGLLIGIGTALLLDKLSDFLYTPKQIKDVTKLPILGVIPYYEELEDSASTANVIARSLQMSQGAISNGNGHRPLDPAFVEAFRSLWTNIRLLNPDAPVRSLVIGSAVPNSGKSTVAIFLARAAATMGQRVLLVDTDLRRPSLHGHLGVNNTRGLTDLISASVTPYQAIQRLSKEDYLFVLTAGSAPPDPPKFFASRRMQSLMEEFHKTFDLVIYDTPPLVGYADALLLTARADGMVLVSRLGKLKRSQLEQALEDLKVAGVSVLGAVANGSKDRVSTPYPPAYAPQEVVGEILEPSHPGQQN
ncbi:MAG: polysaccharide biosynthesis tyrosine autokinase [Leptolyngbyaceae cyanobacterium SM1_4_3]|nr:polysaccharide biosynthesis tyrosine autokinase [Leptolyngbyaceae cyanobacterium SM1_4_3]